MWLTGSSAQGQKVAHFCIGANIKGPDRNSGDSSKIDDQYVGGSHETLEIAFVCLRECHGVCGKQGDSDDAANSHTVLHFETAYGQKRDA